MINGNHTLVEVSTGSHQPGKGWRKQSVLLYLMPQVLCVIRLETCALKRSPRPP